MAQRRQPVSACVKGQLVFLGTGTSVGVPVVGCDCPTCTSTNPRNNRTRCSVVLGLPEGNLLVDTTPDLRSQLLREGIGIVHAVAYTHEHADHLFGLDDVRMFPYYLGGPLPLYCEEQVENRLRRSFDYAFRPKNLDLPAGSIPHLEIKNIAAGQEFSLLGATIRPLRLLHGRCLVVGFRVGNIAYCTDTNEIPDESWPALQGLDVLILDCLRPRPHATHLSLDEAVEVAGQVGAKRTLFTHMAHELEHDATNQTLPPGMELAYDGLRLPLT
ncbi:MAG: MBL fold metallo-hydrolase [Planctomycetia bacterium]|nr:MBL fold metallo-hydrolase [Planctomycetia bacterium]